MLENGEFTAVFENVALDSYLHFNRSYNFVF